MSSCLLFLTFVYVVEILLMCRDLEILCIDVLRVYDMYTWRCMLYIPLRSCLNFYACYILVNFWRRSVYFLNKCFIRVFYRFNRNRALQIP